MEKKEQGRQGKVLSFRQDTAFYHKRAARELGKNDPVRAIYQYRMAYQADPENPETCLALAELLSQMQRHEESNRILFLQLTSGKMQDSELLYGLACNFYGLHEFEYAAQCLERYLEVSPQGTYAYDAEDFLDFLTDESALGESTGLYSDEDYDTDGVIIEARHTLDAGDPATAIAMLEAHTQRYPRSTKAKNQLAIAYYCSGEKEKALELTNEILKTEKNDAQALCNQALFLRATGENEKARQSLESVLKLPEAHQPEILHNLSLLQLEFQQYDAAMETLRELARELPYDENLIHKQGYCRFMMGDQKGAMAAYKKLLSINPSDTVARYYFTLAKRGDTSQAGLNRWMISYHVPFGETFRRLNQLSKLMTEPEEQQLERWKTDPDFRALISWALDIPEYKAKHLFLIRIFSYGDAHAERMLRDYLLRTGQPDDAKRLTLGLLKRMHAREPFMAYLGCDWVMSRVSMMQYPEKLPAAYESVMGQLILSMSGTRSERATDCAVTIFKTYLIKHAEHLPRLTGLQRTAMAAALEFLGCNAANETVGEEEIAKKYKITDRRLKNAVEKLLADEGNKE